MKVTNPTKASKEIVKKLEEVLQDGGTITEACDQAGITRQTYYNWIESDEQFLTKMESAQEYVTEVAKSVIARSITKRKNREDAKWWLERKRKNEFSARSEVTGKDGRDLTPTFVVATEEAKNKLEKLYQEQSKDA